MSTPSRKLAAVLAAAALSITFAACGSDDDESPSDEPAATQTQTEPAGEQALDTDEYIEAVNNVQTEFASGAAELDLANPSGPADFKKSLDRLGVLLDTLIEDLDATDPPEQVTAEHDRLVASLRDYGDLVNANKAGLVSGDQAQVKRSATKIGQGSTRFSQDFDTLIKEINDKLGKETP